MTPVQSAAPETAAASQEAAPQATAAADSGTAENTLAAREPASPAPAPSPSARSDDTRPAPALEQTPVNSDPMQFLAQIGSEVQDRLGAPALIRRDGHAAVWQYRGPDCFLDLYLYRTEAGMRVRHVELRNPSLDRGELRECLARLLRERGRS